MKFSYDLLGGPALIRPIQIYGSTLSEGALVCAGITTGTNFGGAVVAPAGLANVIGVTAEALPGWNGSTVFNQTPSVQSTGVVLLHDVIINPLAVYRIEYSQATTDTLTGVVSTSGTTLSGSSLEDLTGGFVYDITVGQLLYVNTSSTTLTAASPVIATSDYVLKIHRNWGAISTNLVDLNTTATKIGGTGQAQAAAGSGVMTILDTYIQADTIPLTKLRPDQHNGLNLLGKNPKFFADVVFTRHLAFRAS